MNPRSKLLGLLGLLSIAATFPACDANPLQAQGQGKRQRGHYAPNTKQKPDTVFVRFHDHDKGEGILETAIATYEGPRGEKVELISAVHIADMGYYSRLEKLFKSYDSLLYELVKPKGQKPPKPGRKKVTSGGMVSMFQRFMRDTLKLEFQIEAIDYRAKNFVHADLDAETFQKLSKERGESIFVLLFQSMLRNLSPDKDGKTPASKSDPNLGMKLLFSMFSKDRARLMKYLLAKELQNVEELMAGLEKGVDGKGSVILIERNKHVMKVLRERLAKGEKRIGVFYGGAHLSDIEERIFKEIGLRRTGVRWEKAWVITKPKPTKLAPKKNKPDGTGKSK